MTKVTLVKAQSNLAKLIEQAPPGVPLIITRNERPVAQLIPLPVKLPQPVYGNCTGKMIIVSEDDDHLADFAEYM